MSSAVRGRAAGVTTHQSACWPGLQLDYTGDPLKASFCNICVTQWDSVNILYELSPVYVAFAMLNSWTHWLTDIESQNKSLLQSIFYLCFYFTDGAVWELVQRSLATSPLYLLWVLTAEQLACPAPHHTAQLFHKVSLSYHRFLVFVSEAWVPGFCESQATQHQPHQARTVQNQGGWMYLCLRQAVSC